MAQGRRGPKHQRRRTHPAAGPKNTPATREDRAAEGRPVVPGAGRGGRNSAVGVGFFEWLASKAPGYDTSEVGAVEEVLVLTAQRVLESHPSELIAGEPRWSAA